MLGQRRLSIIDLEGGHQPISNADQSLWLVFNGEIYNYQSLRRELEGQGVHFKTASDSEVIIYLYQKMGERCVEQLRGMFAFAIWDVKHKTLFAARDHLGQKPFYYSQRGEEFAFASEIKALLAMDPSLREMNLQALDQYLALRVIAPPRSMFKGISKLPPGHWLKVSPERGIQVERFWALNYEPKYQASEDELTDELEAQLIESLRLHMVSDVPVGAFVSGGLDSTLILAVLMKHVASGSIPTFSMGLPHGQYDEAPAARLVAERFGTEHHEKTLVPSLLDTLPDLIWHLDEPSDSLSVCSYLIAQMASQHVKVVLGGDGGDELFGGYDRYYGNQYAGYYAHIPASIRKYAAEPLLDLMPAGRWYKSKGHQLKWLHKMSFLQGGARYALSLSYFYFDAVARPGLYGPRMHDAAQQFDAEADIRRPFDNANAAEAIDRMLWADSQVRMPDHSVMILDRMTMAHSLEARSPFMDHKLAEFAARLPMDVKVRGRSLRRIQKRLAARYLPEEILERPKQGFASALPYMLKAEYQLLFRLFLQDSRLVAEGVFEQAPIDELLGQHLAGKVDNGNRLWLLLNSELWYRMFIDGISRTDLAQQITEAAPQLKRHAA